MNEETQKYNNLILEKVAANLEKNFFNVQICQTKEEALSFLQKEIKLSDTIGYGGSKTLEEIGFFDSFTTKSHPNLLDRRKKDITPEEKRILQGKGLTADVFLASPNGISLDGQMVFIDKFGNRNAAVTYGPKHVYLIASVNKIANSIEDAKNRASNIAAVKNNIRFETDNPCTTTGECVNCSKENRLCGITTILHRCFPAKTKTVILINQQLGF